MAVRLLLLAPLAAASKMTLVETIPLLDLDEIQLTPGAVNTWEAHVADRRVVAVAREDAGPRAEAAARRRSAISTFSISASKNASSID